MSIHFCENGLRDVAAGLSSLSTPTPDKVEQIANRLQAIRFESAGMKTEDLSKAAKEAEECARAIMLDTGDAHAACVRAMYRLGHLLLLQLVKHAESPHTLEASRWSLERKILVVDDSRVAAVALSNALVAKDFLVRSVATLEEALAEFRSFAPTVLVSDVHMPNLDVGVLCRSFRELSQGRPTLVVLVSGTTGAELEARLDEIKPDAFLPKMTGTAPVIDRVLELWDALHTDTSK
jgi:two-component system, cell cycle response regulator DivK